MQQSSAKENRRHFRTKGQGLSALVQPLSKSREPIGPQVLASTDDHSESGIGLLLLAEHVDRFDYAHVLAMLPSGQMLDGVVEIRYRDDRNDRVGARFLADAPPRIF